MVFGNFGNSRLKNGPTILDKNQLPRFFSNIHEPKKKASTPISPMDI
jgi:hypothetical protein